MAFEASRGRKVLSAIMVKIVSAWHRLMGSLVLVQTSSCPVKMRMFTLTMQPMM